MHPHAMILVFGWYTVEGMTVIQAVYSMFSRSLFAAQKKFTRFLFLSFFLLFLCAVFRRICTRCRGLEARVLGLS